MSMWHRSLRVAGRANLRNKSMALPLGINSINSYGRNFSDLASIRATGKMCGEQLETHDFDSHIVGLFMPRDIRSVYYILKSYNYEIASIKDHCHGNVAAGDIRFRWWEDILSKIEDPNFAAPTSLQHPVAEALFRATRTYKMSPKWLFRNLDTRRFDLTMFQPPELSYLEDYAERTYSPLNYLMLEALNIDNEQVSYMASHFGVCTGIATLLQSFPYHQNQTYIPVELAEKHNINPAKSISALSREELDRYTEAVFEIASISNGHYLRGCEIYRAEVAKNPNIKILAYTVIPSKRYLDELLVYGCNPHAVRLHSTKHKLKMHTDLSKLKFFGELSN